MEKIYLIGFMAVGKSTVGKELALLKNWEFLDCDSYIEEKNGMAIPQIFAELGEIYFRLEERELLVSLIKKDRLVIATGGGMPVYFNNMALMKKSGFVVYLRLPFNKIKERLSQNDLREQRPMANRKNLEALFEYRKPFYEQAHFICDVEGLTPISIAEKVSEAYDKWKR